MAGTRTDAGEEASLGEVQVQPAEQVLQGALELGVRVVFGELFMEPFYGGEVVEIDPPIDVGDRRFTFVERLLGCCCLRAEDGRLEEEMTQKEAGEGPVGVDRVGVAEPTRRQGGQEVLNHPKAA